MLVGSGDGLLVGSGIGVAVDTTAGVGDGVEVGIVSAGISVAVAVGGGSAVGTEVGSVSSVGDGWSNTTGAKVGVEVGVNEGTEAVGVKVGTSLEDSEDTTEGVGEGTAIGVVVGLTFVEGSDRFANTAARATPATMSANINAPPTTRRILEPYPEDLSAVRSRGFDPLVTGRQPILMPLASAAAITQPLGRTRKPSDSDSLVRKSTHLEQFPGRG